MTGRLVGSGDTGVLLAHGAGTDQDHPFMVLLRDGLAERGLAVLTFNYAYSEKGSKRPDQETRLIEVHRAAADLLESRVARVFLAGRSMGGRMGMYLADEGWPAAGVILYAYPLHPAGKPERLRIGRFPDAPMLFFHGTRDALARMDLFEQYVAPLPNATIEVLEGASHSPKGGGWTTESTADFLTKRTAEWISEVGRGTGYGVRGTAEGD